MGAAKVDTGVGEAAEVVEGAAMKAAMEGARAAMAVAAVGAVATSWC